jgi:hypothetical protein
MVSNTRAPSRPACRRTRRPTGIPDGLEPGSINNEFKELNLYHATLLFRVSRRLVRDDDRAGGGEHAADAAADRNLGAGDSTETCLRRERLTDSAGVSVGRVRNEPVCHLEPHPSLPSPRVRSVQFPVRHARAREAETRAKLEFG